MIDTKLKIQEKMSECENFQGSLLKELLYITYSSVNRVHHIVPCASSM